MIRSPNLANSTGTQLTTNQYEGLVYDRYGTIINTPLPDYEVENPGRATQTVRLTLTIATSTYYYLFTDHLGSTVLMGSQNSAKNQLESVTGSRATYYPFGDYRGRPPTQTLTDRGFTGQKSNNQPAADLGLLYYNARYYAPGIARFISADTIVPDPANPQAFNRYAYVRNNPISRIDLFGHADCTLLGDSHDIQGCSPPLSLLVDFKAVAGESWSAKEKAVVQSAAWQVAWILFQTSGGQFNSLADAFLSVYSSPVIFEKTGVSASNLGEASAKNHIWVNNQSDNAKITDATVGTIWAAHELGHAFNYALSPNQTEPDYDHGQGLIDLAQEGVWVNEVLISGANSSDSWLGDYTRGEFRGYQTDTSPYIQNDLETASEDFADMFSNYVYSSFAPDNYGVARYNFMDNHMRSWIALAVSNNE